MQRFLNLMFTPNACEQDETEWRICKVVHIVSKKELDWFFCGTHFRTQAGITRSPSFFLSFVGRPHHEQGPKVCWLLREQGKVVVGRQV